MRDRLLLRLHPGLWQHLRPVLADDQGLLFLGPALLLVAYRSVLRLDGGGKLLVHQILGGRLLLIIKSIDPHSPHIMADTNTAPADDT